MTHPVPTRPKIYHIVHMDRLAAIIASGGLMSDFQINQQQSCGTTIGMSHIKDRRLNELQLDSHPQLFVGQCVPFYFCPRSIMLYIIHMGNSTDLSYRGGQGPIIHLVSDLYSTVEWAQAHNKRWAFTLTNAGSRFFEDRSDLSQLGEINWPAVNTNRWSGCKDQKQAEFLVEDHFPWSLVERIGVIDAQIYGQAINIVHQAQHRPIVEIKRDWYY